MRELYRRLPTLTGLVAFESAGRHSNFSRAAEELHVTQAAVSRQIRALEEQLGLTLFTRLHRSVALTDDGERLHRAVSHGFDHIADAITQMRHLHASAQVNVGANHAVAFYWLRPRLAAFQEAHPEVRLGVFAADTDAPFGEGELDIAIRYGNGVWPDATAELLFEESLFPVCAPAYFERAGPLAEPADLLHHTLLYMEPQGADWVTWSEWLRAQDVRPGDALTPGLTFNSFPLLLQAAIDVEGVALGTNRLLDPLLADGTLMRPMDHVYRTGRGYYVALPLAGGRPDGALEFRDWLMR
jgi:LysR family transcriptional regulator, glycine cleavage system transcriptional activator